MATSVCLRNYTTQRYRLMFLAVSIYVPPTVVVSATGVHLSCGGQLHYLE